MNQPETIRDRQVVEAMEAAIREQAYAIMTHLSRGKWHMTKAALRSAANDKLNIEIIPHERPHPVNIHVDQPVGMSLKLGYNKYIFDTVVLGFEPSVKSAGGGTVILAMPDRADKLQRRSFFRVPVPMCFNVKTLFWHRGYRDGANDVPFENYWQAKLVDISAGGMQIAVESSLATNFRIGQLVGLQFTPMPYEKPILLEAQIRHTAPTADGSQLYMGLQIIGLEASPEGREVLAQLCGIVEQYHQINQCSSRPLTVVV
ncbi:MAG TPA: PilZ domain-containing protein [Sedimentisphaerales bacterium]|nr:PilZ domain-containing protein [Sedimentisphaerales bacterium]